MNDRFFNRPLPHDPSTILETASFGFARNQITHNPGALTEADRAIIVARDFKRLDGGPVILNPHGNEADIARFFIAPKLEEAGLLTVPDYSRKLPLARTILEENVVGKRVLVVPGYGTNAFMFGHLGAKEVVGVDSDPTTIAWLRGLAAFHDHNQIGALICGEIDVPYGSKQKLNHENRGSLPKLAIERMIEAAASKCDLSPREGISFVNGALGGELVLGSRAIPSLRAAIGQDSPGFDLVYVPYLLGISKGIMDPSVVDSAFRDLRSIANPTARILIAPFTHTDRESAEVVTDSRGIAIIESLAARARAAGFIQEAAVNTGGDFIHGVLRMEA